MCGIAGLVYEGVRRKAAMAAVRRMIALQRHRGPDGEGFYDTAGASLGHCRLAIIDLTDAGHQPMSDSNDRYWITYNGEIYNYLELAEELRGLGYQFKGHSDTEVLLTAYRHWGKACLERLRGMFAFAIWDQKERSLFAARDRLGIKPFHYWADGNLQLAFASELKALLEFLPDRMVNTTLARQFLAWNLLDHEPNQTMVSGIMRLSPGHALIWRQGEGLQIWRYWELHVNDDFQVSPEHEVKLIGEFRRLFEEAVSLHLRSDVSVGTCLSGGLDSSTIVCVANLELQRRRLQQQHTQHTFSACFEDPRLDERAYIEAVVEATGCQSHYVFPSGEEFAKDLEQWVWHQEEPVGGSGVYAQYCLARLARENGIKVLLDGQGADEQLAGYRKFILVYLRQLLNARSYVTAVREAVAFFCRPEIIRTSRFVDARRYLYGSLPESAVLWPEGSFPGRPNALGVGVSLGSRIQADLTRFSLPALLRFEDRNMMAFGIESRVPFVDHVLVEWVAKLPASLRLSGGWTKLILREAFRGVLPERIRTRRGKLGFLTPEPAWLAGPLSTWFRDTLSAPRYLGAVIDVRGLKSILGRYYSGDRSLPVENLLFRLAMYESWARQFLGTRPPSVDPVLSQESMRDER
ncbi:MAG TPA: asparagine synthase (glutamine-hydrolyzing) [Nitrospira sp.]|nr:asparagine synthase (glutamine-hydrolyzing) [Nitrospira sp.]